MKNTGGVYVRAHVHAYAKSNFKTGGRRKKRVPAGATGERAVTSSSTGRTGRRRSGGSALDVADVQEDGAGLSVTRLLVVAPSLERVTRLEWSRVSRASLAARSGVLWRK